MWAAAVGGWRAGGVDGDGLLGWPLGAKLGHQEHPMIAVGGLCAQQWQITMVGGRMPPTATQQYGFIEM